jgi:uncharacterized protein
VSRPGTGGHEHREGRSRRGRPGPLQIVVADLLRRPGETRTVERSVALDDLRLSSAWVEPGDEVDVDLTLETILGGMTATGTVRAHWRGVCRRCLDPIEGDLEVEVREVFAQDPTDEDLHPIDVDRVDLEPVVREAVMLGLPLAPLCSPDCRGPAPDEFPTHVEGEPIEAEGEGEGQEAHHDPRWAALDDLRFEE